MILDRALSAHEPVSILVLDGSFSPVTGATVVCDVIDFATNTTLNTISLTETPGGSGYYVAASDVTPTASPYNATLGSVHLYKFRQTAPTTRVLSMTGVAYRTLETAAEAIAAVQGTGFTAGVDDLHSLHTLAAGAATSSALSTAQSDLTAIKGSGFTGGVDDLHSAHALLSGAATATGLTAAVAAIETHGDASWLTATGFATSTDLNTDYIGITNAIFTLQGHGDVNWATATGFALATDLATAQSTLTAIQGSGWGSGDNLHAINAAIAALPSVSATASAIWGASLSSYSDRTLAGGALRAIRMLSFNRLEEAPGNPGTLTLYADDASTVFVTFNITDYQGAALVGLAGQPARRTAAV